MKGKKVAAPKKAAAPAKKAPAKKALAKKAPAKKAASKTKPPKQPAQVRDRARLFIDGARFGAASIALQPAGELHVPSGRIVTCDPFVVDGPTLERAVTPGSYPVVLSVAVFADDQRVAAATVRFADRAVAQWIPGGDYTVDAGTGAFVDARAHAAILAEPPHWPTPSYTALEHQLLTEHYTHTWGWASYRPAAGDGGNCVAFMSGYGDGVYTSYWGLDDAGDAVALTTDFEVFTDEDWASAGDAISGSGS